MNRRLLPIGIQTFRKIREDDAYYVDKTPLIRSLTETSGRYFLSRPRRFGKSLLVDTLKELFEGSEELFRGLHIHDHWDWSTHYPVVHIDFSGGYYHGKGDLVRSLEYRLFDLEKQHGLVDGAGVSESFPEPERFSHLFRRLHEKTGQRVVVLIDEYDKPILDVLEDPDRARANRDILKAFYTAIKASDAHVRFVLLTGVSKFSKINLFSGLNNLMDITLDPRYSTICGYTETDLDEVFAPELPGLDRDRIRDWYNGYGWLGEEKVYNPFDMLLLFSTRKFKAHWFETGTPTFLVEHLLRHNVRSVDLENLMSSEDLLSAFDVEAIAPEALLFQTGYLTILEELHDEEMEITEYRLGYPNREVKQNLNRFWVNYMSGDALACHRTRSRLRQVLRAGDTDGLRDAIHALFAEIPYQWHTKNPISDYEGYYASVFYSHLAALGFDLAAESSTSRGRVDLVLKTPDRVYLFEFKVIEGETPTGEALRQIQEKDYAAAYRAAGLPIHLVGVEFSKTTHNVVAIEVA